MHLLALVDSPGHVCCRYRLAAFRSHLERAGHTLELRPWPRHWWAWLRVGRELRGADAVVLQRRLLPRWQLYLLRRAAPRLLFDFDDAVFLRDSYSPKGLHSRRRLRRFAATVAACDLVIAGNDFLAAAARCWTPPDRVQVIPTCVDPGHYRVRDHGTAGNSVRLVWVGSSSTLRGLDEVRPALDRLAWGLPQLSLKVICDRFPTLQNLPVVERRWSELHEAAEIAASDIGISWVPDDDWSRGKCGLKVLQYMAAGLPVVANSVGVHAEMVQHGETGLLADTPETWAEAVLDLVHDAESRRRMGRAGRRLLERKYGVAVGGKAWIQLLTRLASRRAA